MRQIPIRNPFAARKKARYSDPPLPPNLEAPAMRMGHLPSASYSSSLGSPPSFTSKVGKDAHFEDTLHEEVPTLSRRNSLSGAENGDIVNNFTTPSQPVDEEEEQTNIIKMAKNDYFALIKLLKTMSYRDFARTLVQRYLWKWYALLVVVVVITVLLSSHHDQIVKFMKPAGDKIRSWPGGWLIPIAILIIISFPPLVGHEVIGILIGVLWGLNIGFWILAAGTFMGELATWFVFRTLCTTRADKFERKNKYYAALTQLIREKSFWFVLVLRFSAIPGHVTTALSSSAGAKFWSYCAAAVLTLPKQLSLVYLGTAFNSKNSTTHAVSIATMLLTVVGTGIAAIYIYYQMRIYLQRKAKLARLAGIATDPASGPEMSTLGESSGALDALADEEDKMTKAGYPPAYPDSPGSGLAGADEPVLAYRQAHMQKHGRRPFLHSNSSFGVLAGGRNPPSRSKSLHQSDFEFLPEYRDGPSIGHGSIQPAGLRTPEVIVSRTSVESDRFGGQLIDFDRITPVETPRWSADGNRSDQLGESFMHLPTPVRNRERSDTNASSTSRASESLLGQYEEIVGAGEMIRGTASLDLWRPAHMSLHAHHREAESKRSNEEDAARVRSPPVSGRELALQADEYAIQRGSRRPDYGRTRGESSAALLPRPGSAQDTRLAHQVSLNSIKDGE